MDNFSVLMKLDELVSSVRKKEGKSKTRDAIVIALAVLGVVVTVAGVAYAVYRFATPTEDEFNNDLDDDFNDDKLIAFGDEGEEGGRDAEAEDKE